MLKIYKASAGSGKTFTLTREYIRLLIGRTDPETGRESLRTPADYGFGKPKAQSEILAVTFTNKATEEMTDRIIDELFLLAHLCSPLPGMKGSKHADFFMEHFGCSKEALAAASARALQDLLFNFSSFNVSTIDSFFQNILRVFARDLDLPDNYTIEIKQKNSVRLALSQLMNDLNRPADEPADSIEGKRRRFLSDAFYRYMLRLFNEGKTAQLLSQSSRTNGTMIESINKLFNEDYKMRRTEMDAYLNDPDKVRFFAEKVAGLEEKERKRIADIGRALLNAGPDKIVQKMFINLATKMAEGKEVPETTDPQKIRAADGNFYLKDWQTGKKPVPAELQHAVDELSEFILSGSDLLNFCRKVREVLPLLTIFGATVRALDRYCRENDSFLLGDTNSLIHELIDQTDAPFIYERTGTRIDHYLIDEFQDTSRMQWRNFSPLMAEGLSHGYANLIIGDEKQCIYRFRNSDPGLLGSKVQDEFTSGTYRFRIEERGVKLSQNVNYRSAPEVVMFNNTVFRYMADLIDDMSVTGSHSVRNAYRGLVQQVGPGNQQGMQGYVKVLMRDGDKSTADAQEAATEGVTPEALLTLRQLTDEIERELGAGFRPGQILVLVRTHDDGRAVINHLLRRIKEESWPFGNVAIMSSDALTVGSNPTVRHIVNILELLSIPGKIIDPDSPAPGSDGRAKMVDNPDFKRRRLVHRYQMYLDTPDEASGKYPTPTEALRRAIEQEALADEAGSEDVIIRNLRELADRPCPGLYELVETAAKMVVTPRTAERDNAFITAFLDLVVDFVEGGRSDLGSFLKWWDESGCNVTLESPEGLDAITVTTVHQAKGLEFDCVHVPFFSKTLVRATGMEWFPLNHSMMPGIPAELIPPMMPVELSYGLEKLPQLKGWFSEFCEEQRLDALNVAYVAFTRAKLELVVYADCRERLTLSGRPAAHSETLGQMLRKSLNGADRQWLDNLKQSDTEGLTRWMTDLASHITDLPAEATPAEAAVSEEGAGGGEITTVFELGQPVTPVDNDTPDNSSENPFALKAPLPLDCMERFSSFDRPEIAVADDADQQYIVDLDNERSRGIFLHRVLSAVSHLADLPLAMRRAAYRECIDDEDADELLRMLTHACSAPEVRPWFEDYVNLANERPAVTEKGNRRPDRIVWMPDGTVHVIDYKFGAEDPRYYAQVRNYMWILRKSGHKNVRGFLFYPERGIVRPVPLFAPKSTGKPDKPE